MRLITLCPEGSADAHIGVRHGSKIVDLGPGARLMREAGIKPE